jgi:hypothetical protein
VILEKETHSRTTNHRSFYTDLRRAHDAAVVVTDSARRLALLVRSDLPKSAALDIAEAMGSGAISHERERGWVGVAARPASATAGHAEQQRAGAAEGA